MKHAIFSFTPMSWNSLTPSANIAHHVSRVLEVPIIDSVDVGNHDFEVLLIVNGAYGYGKPGVLEALAKAVESARHVVWIQNDYTIRIPRHEGKAESPFRKAFRIRHSNGTRPVDFWSTVEYMAKPGVSKLGKRIIGEHSRYINWNCLTWDPMDDVRPTDERLHGDALIYYGSYREYREKYFERYFQFQLPMAENNWELHIGSAGKAEHDAAYRKFDSKFGDVGMVDVLLKFDDLVGSLRQYGAGLYIEDRQTHKHFMSPANRFYEMLSAGLPIIFQPECRATFARTKYDIGDYVAPFSSSLWKKFALRDRIMGEQYERWADIAHDERNALDDVVREAWDSVLGSLK